MPETNETMLEQTFSDLAFATLRDKAPALVDYLLGFQMIKSEQEGKRAVGLFGLEIDGKVYYVPVFFLSGEVRGMDSIYSVDSDLFVPLTEDWQNSLINKQSVTVGDVNMKDRASRGVAVPNYTRLKTIPSGHGGINLKLSSAAIEKMQITDDVEGYVSLPDGLASAGLTGQFKVALEKHPKLLEAFRQFYDVADLYTPPVQAKVAAESPVTVINTITDAGVKDMTDEQRQAVLAGGIAVIDKRPEVAKSRTYASETRQTLENPTIGSIYDVLWATGDVSPALIVPVAGDVNSVAVVRMSDGKHCIIGSQAVYCLQQYNRAEFIKQLGKLGRKPSSVRPKETVLFVSDNGTSPGAYCVETATAGIDGVRVLRVLDSYLFPVWTKPAADPPAYDILVRRREGPGSKAPTKSYWSGGGPVPCTGSCGSRKVDNVLVTEIGSSEPKFVAEKLIVNDQHFWALPLNQFSLEEKQTYKAEEYQEAPVNCQLVPADFGDDITLLASLKKTASAVDVWATDHLITIADEYGTRALTKKAAYTYCLLKHGMTEADTRAVIDGVRRDKQTFFVKKAEQAEQFVDFPSNIMDETFGNEMSQYHRGQVPLELYAKRTPANNREYYMYQSPFGPGGESDDDSTSGTPLDRIMQAAQTGQKEVFDAAALGSLIKSNSPTDMVDRFLPTIISGMDRLGRMLFLIYWHYDAFEDRYGDNELSDFIDSLKATFENLGDIVTFTKRRSLAGDPDFYGTGVESLQKTDAE